MKGSVLNYVWKKPSSGSSSGGFKFKGVQDGFSAREAFAKN